MFYAKRLDHRLRRAGWQRLVALAFAAACLACGGGDGEGRAPADGGGDAGEMPSTVGLIGLYRFDEGTGALVGDAIGGAGPMELACQGSCENGPPGWSEGRTGGAVELFYFQSGQIAPSPRLAALHGAFTIAVWVQRIYAHLDTDDRSILGREAEARDGSSSFRLSYIDSRLHAWSGATRVVDPEPIPARFFHVALRYDGATLALFRDGVLAAEAPAAAPAAATTPLLIGTAQAGGLYLKYADSLFDDLRIYERALPADEIAQLAR